LEDFVKSESAATSVIRLAKISDRFGARFVRKKMAKSSRPERVRSLAER
jgi:hypothetical protein